MPFEALCVSDSLSHAAHEDLNWPGVFILAPVISPLLFQAQLGSQFWFRNRPNSVYFVSQYHNRHFLEFWNFQDTLQFDSTFLKALMVAGIDEVDDSIDI